MKKLLAYSGVFLLSVAPMVQNALALESVNSTQSISTGVSDTVARVSLPTPVQPKYVPYTVYMVPLASVQLTAPNTSDTTVTELTFQSQFVSGASLGPSKIDKIYISKDGKNIASTTTKVTENTYSVKLKEAYTLSRGASVVFDLTLGEMNAKPNQQFNLSLQSVVANIPVSGTPTNIGTFATTTYDLSSLTIGKYSSGVTLTSGDMRVIAPIELTAEKRDITVSRIALTDTGDNNLKNTFTKPSLWDVSTNTMIAEGKVTENAIVFDTLNIKASRYDVRKYQIRANILGSGASSNFSFSMKHDNNLVATEDMTNYRAPINGEDDYRSYVKVISSGSTAPVPVIPEPMPAPISVPASVPSKSTTQKTSNTPPTDIYSPQKDKAVTTNTNSPSPKTSITSSPSVSSRSIVSGEISFVAKTGKNTAKRGQAATFFEGKILTKSDQTIRELVVTPALFGARGIQDFQDGKLSVRINGAEIGTISRLDTTIKLPVNIVTSKNVPLILTITGTLKNEKQVRGSYQFTVKLSQIYSAGVPLTGDKKATGYKTTVKK